jgi:hypothetical protein
MVHVSKRGSETVAKSKKKQTLAIAHAEYHALVNRAKDEIGRQSYMPALRNIVQAWDHLALCMEYEQKHEGREFSNIESIDIALRYAPLVFATHVLDKLQALLKSKRRIDRDASDDLATMLADARVRLGDARRVWNAIESEPGRNETAICESLGHPKQRWEGLIRDWRTMRVLRRASDGGLYLETDVNEFVNGCCRTCGAIARLPKTLLLEPAKCEKCQRTVQFVLLAS